MTNVLQIVADGAPGGGTTHVLQVLQGLRDRGGRYRTGLVTQRDSHLSERAAALGVEVFGADFFRSRYDPAAVLAVRRAVRSFEPDLVHCHGGRAGLFHALALSDVPTIYTVHGFHFPRKSLLLRRLGAISERFVMSRAAAVVFVCAYDERITSDLRLIRQTTPRHVIYNGVSLPDPASIKPVALARPAAGAASGPLVGFVARLVPQKHPELFLRVMEQLPGHRAVLVGDGPLAPTLRDEIARRGLGDRIRLLGGLPREQILVLLKTLDVLVMTSRWEGLPILPLEAMSLGVPVVSTAVGGMTEILEHRASGMLARGESPEELAAAVRELTTDAALRAAIVERAKQRVGEVFSEERMLGSLEEVYASVAFAPTGRRAPARHIANETSPSHRRAA